MIIKRTHFILIAIWIIFVLLLLFSLEVCSRIKLGYRLNLPILDKSPYFELDKTKKYNGKFVEEKKEYFQNWPTQLETFEVTVSAPRYLFKPNLKMASINGKLVPAKDGDKIYWSSNSWGFRGKDFSVDKPDNFVRIVALGASTTEGSQSDNETYPFYLEKILNDKGHDVEVINAGHHGQNIDDLVEMFKRRVLPLKPDILIFYEVSNNTNPGEWLKDNWDGWYSWDAGYGKIFRFFHQRSAFFVFLAKQLGFERKRPPVKEHTLDFAKDKSTQENFERKVRDLILLVKENQIKPVLATFITAAEQNLNIDHSQNKGLWEDLYLKWYPFTPAEVAQIYEKYNQSLIEIAREEDTLSVDLARQFPKDQRYFTDHIHFTPEGNQILAGLIADFLEREVLSENSTIAD